jgi:hypothetical protein
MDYVDHLEIMRNFLEKAGFEIKITEDRDQLTQNISNHRSIYWFSMPNNLL